MVDQSEISDSSDSSSEKSKETSDGISDSSEEETSDGSGDESDEEPAPPPPKRPRTKRPWNETIDRFSALQDSLLVHILSFLPMKEVVKCGSLSKRWQYLWTSVSTLVFHSSDHHQNRIAKFVAFVNHALVLCNCSNIKRFAVNFLYRQGFASSVNLWLRFATQNNVKDLDLGLDLVGTCLYKLPQHLYTNSSITKLRLSKLAAKPSGVVSWRSLKSLSIENVNISDDAMGKIFSGSPLLELLEFDVSCKIKLLDINSQSLKKLVLRHYRKLCENSPVLEIRAPNIQWLEILGPFYERKFRLMYVKSLVSANISFTMHTNRIDGDDDFKEQENMMRELLESLRHVKELKLGPWCIQVLSILEVKGLRPSSLSCKCLIVETHIRKWDIPAIASLLQSSPNLETLLINMSKLQGLGLSFGANFLNSYNFDGENYWTSQTRIFECLLGHLKTVKIVGIMGGCGEFKLALIQFLLKNARVLEKMVINVRRFC